MPKGYKKDGNYSGIIFKKGIHPKTEFKKGYIQSEETKRKRVENRKGFKHSEKSKIKMRKARLGCINSEETRKKISNSLKGNKNATGHKLSKEAKRKISKFFKGRFTGDKSPSWKGGITPEYVKQRNNNKTKLWRKRIFKKNNYTCQKCKDKTGHNLCAHHIQNFADYPELRFITNNGITLCRNCHKIFHKIYGLRKNNKEQILRFLKY